MPIGMEVGFGPGDFVLDGDPVPLPLKKGAQPQFRPMSIVANTAGFISIPLGTEVGFSPGDAMLDEDPAPPLP